MFQLTRVASRTESGQVAAVIRALPFVIGREKSADLQLEQPGIWNSHATFQLDPNGRVVIDSHPECSSWLNDQLLEGSTPLKPGDILKIGPTALRFELSSVEQRNPAIREWLLYLLVVFFIGSQIFFIYTYLAD
jgi:pSer/pThr/pTyr-binding forkhead associated (FHA) protein